MNKKIIIMAILMLAVTSMPCASYATDTAWGQASFSDGVAPRWAGMGDYESDLTIRSGKAVCSVLVEAASAKVDKVGFSIKLQQYQNGNWKTIESWDQKVSPENGNAKLKESCSISKGFTYRFTGTIKTYKNGKLLDTCTITSAKKTY